MRWWGWWRRRKAEPDRETQIALQQIDAQARLCDWALADNARIAERMRALGGSERELWEMEHRGRVRLITAVWGMKDD